MHASATVRNRQLNKETHANDSTGPQTSSRYLDDLKVNYNYCSNNMIGFDLRRWRGLFYRSALVPIQHTSAAPVTGCQCHAAFVLQHPQTISPIKIFFFFFKSSGTPSSRGFMRRRSVKAGNCRQQSSLFFLFFNI